MSRFALRAGFAAWRRLGPRRGTVAAARAAGVLAHGPWRRAVVRVRPPGAGSARGRAGARGPGAGGGAARPGDGGAADRGRVGARRSERWIRQARRALIARADAILAHRFDLLGLGPRRARQAHRLAPGLQGRAPWPADHISRIVISYPDGSDIKVPWELSRFQHLPLLAAAHRLSGDERYLDEIGAQLEYWIAANPVEIGVNWACTMDVAIRAANWVAALAMCADGRRGRPWLERRDWEPAGPRALHPLTPGERRDPRQPLPVQRRRSAGRRRAVLRGATGRGGRPGPPSSSS